MICRVGFSTPQLPDYLIYKGDTLPIDNLILEDYFNQANKSYQVELFGLKLRDLVSLNCVRGYQAIYEIDNDSLFLTHILSCWGLKDMDTLDISESNKRLTNIFSDKVNNGRVFIDWFTDKISIPNEKFLRWDGVFYRIFEGEILVVIENGIVLVNKELDNYIDKPKGINRKYNDMISTVIFNELKKVKWKNIGVFDCSKAYLITIRGNGKICDIAMANYQTKEEIKEFWNRREYNYCIRKVQKALRKLEFDIINYRGERYIEKVYVEIWDDSEL